MKSNDLQQLPNVSSARLHSYRIHGIATHYGLDGPGLETQ